MKFHSDYYDYGFSRIEIEKFLLGFDIKLTAEEPPLALQDNKFPEWAEELKAKEVFTAWQAASILIGANPYTPDHDNLQYDERYNLAKDLLDEAVTVNKLKGDLPNGTHGGYSFRHSDLRVWAASIQRDWCIPRLENIEATETVNIKLQNNDVVIERLQQSERENAGLLADKAKLSENLAKAQETVTLQKQQLKDAADRLAASMRQNATFQTEFDSLKADALEGKTKSTLLRMLGGMAMIGAEIDIHASRISGLGQTVGDLALKGVVVDDDTLSKRLKEAAALIAKPSKQ
jgi:hypothetical protein